MQFLTVLHAPSAAPLTSFDCDPIETPAEVHEKQLRLSSGPILVIFLAAVVVGFVAFQYVEHERIRAAGHIVALTATSLATSAESILKERHSDMQLMEIRRSEPAVVEPERRSAD